MLVSITERTCGSGLRKAKVQTAILLFLIESVAGCLWRPDQVALGWAGSCVRIAFEGFRWWCRCSGISFFFSGCGACLWDLSRLRANRLLVDALRYE